MNYRKLQIVIICILLLVLPQISFSQNKIIDRIEPPFWWAGMQDSELQLLVHGDNITDLTPVISYNGATLKQIIKVENPNYLFLSLSLSNHLNPRVFPIDFKRNGKVVYSYNYELKQRKANSAKRKGFSNKDIIYLITPDRFVNGDETNDNVEWMKEKSNRKDKSGRHGGDIKGIIDKLDYIQDMGFTGMWINPLLENNMDKYSYHGYSTTDFYKIDERYGTNKDYLKLSEEASKRNILLIMDMIANHCGLNHWWTGDEPTSDWYNFQSMENKPFTSHKRTSLADPYATEIDKKMFSDGWFVSVMPDMNQKNKLLATYLIQNSIWWIEYANLGGIRQDTYSYPDADFMTDWTKRIMQEYPDFNIVGEEWSLNPAIVSRWQAGKKNVNDYLSYLPTLMDFPIQNSLVLSLNKEKAPYSNTFDGLYEMLGNDFLYNDPYNLMIFLDNHDMARFYNQVNYDLDLFKMGVVYLYTTRGIPQVYYGTEILMNSKNNPDDHGLIRSDFPGGWNGDKVNVFNENGLSKDQKEVKEMFKKLNHFRKETSALQNGKLKHYVPVDEVYVMFRYDKHTKIMSFFNKNKKNTNVDLGRFNKLLQGNTTAKNILTNENYDLTKGTIIVPAMTALMLVVE